MPRTIDVEIMPYGPPSVQAWKAQRPMYSAHRGGSYDWPEHSLRAYTQAVGRGYGCLEVSLARTLDGVYVCNHDADINAVVYGNYSGLPPISEMTLADVKSYQIRGPVNHRERAPEPFMTLEELLDIYGQTHVFMIDPKTIASGNYDTLLDFLDARGGNTRFIGKWVGSNVTWTDKLAARGYERWGAFYASDWSTGGSGFPSSFAAQYTMLGLDYNASQAHWDEIRAADLPVIGHVCESVAAVDTARSKGADGFQVSGIEAVDPYTA